MSDASSSAGKPFYKSCNPQVPVSCNRPTDCSGISGDGYFSIFPFGINRDIEALCKSGVTKIELDASKNFIKIVENGNTLGEKSFENIEITITGTGVEISDANFGKYTDCLANRVNEMFVVEYLFTLPSELRFLIDGAAVTQSISGSLPVEADSGGCFGDNFLTSVGNSARSGRFDDYYDDYGNYSDLYDSFFSFDLDSYGFYPEETFPETENLSDRKIETISVFQFRFKFDFCFNYFLKHVIRF